MSSGSSKTRRNDRPTPVRTAVRTIDPVREIGNQDMINWPWVLRMRRFMANLFADKAQRVHGSSDAESKTALTITEQIYLQMERMDCGYGYQEPLRHRTNIDPLDQLLAPARKEVKDAEFRRPDEPSED